MKCLWKWTTALVGGVVLAFIVAIAAIVFLLDPNQMKPLLISQVKNATGFEMAIPGNLSWSFYPHLGVKADAIEVKHSPDFSATLQQVILRVKIQPLFHQQLEFSKVSIAALQVNQVQATAVGAKVKFQDQLLQIQPLTANFYQGILQSKVQISLKKASPVVQVVADLKNVDLASLMKSLSGEPGQLSFEGRATMTADVNTQGNKTEELLKHLNGSGSFSLDKGVMKGIDLAFYVETAAALINKQSLPTRLPHDQSEVGRLTGTAVIKNGVLYNTDLLLESPLFTTTGKGSINLVKKTLDYHLEVTPQAGQSNNALWALAGKKVPIHVSGYWNNPTVSLDTLALMQAIGKEQLQKVQEQIQKALPDKASKFIQNLFH